MCMLNMVYTVLIGARYSFERYFLSSDRRSQNHWHVNFLAQPSNIQPIASLCWLEIRCVLWLILSNWCTYIPLYLRVVNGHLYGRLFELWAYLSTNSALLKALGTTKVLLNTLRPRQNGHNFADNIFKCIFLNENVRIPIIISLKFVPEGHINNIPALAQIMAGRRPGDKPFSEPMMFSLLTHACVTRSQQVNRYVN